MKIKIAAILLASCFSAHAMTDEEAGKFCTVIGDVAESAAEARNNGVPLSKVMEVIRGVKTTELEQSFFRKMTIDIYSRGFITKSDARRVYEVACYQNVAKLQGPST